jgi:hypothetical protein
MRDFLVVAGCFIYVWALALIAGWDPIKNLRRRK